MNTNLNQPHHKMRKLKDFSDGSKRQKAVLSAVSIGLGIFFWYLLTLIPSINTFLASPKQVIDELIIQINANSRYFKDIWASLQRVLSGFALAFIAIPVAFLMGWYPKLRSLIEPWIQFSDYSTNSFDTSCYFSDGSKKQKDYIIFIAAFLVMVLLFTAKKLKIVL